MRLGPEGSPFEGSRNMADFQSAVKSVRNRWTSPAMQPTEDLER
jgi:hypothetical protein